MAEPAIYRMPARLTRVEAMGILAELEKAMASGTHSIDLRELSEFDSAALALLLAVRRSWAASGQAPHDQPRFVNVPEKLEKLAQLYGVDSLVFPND